MKARLRQRGCGLKPKAGAPGLTACAQASGVSRASRPGPGASVEAAPPTHLPPPSAETTWGAPSTQPWGARTAPGWRGSGGSVHGPWAARLRGDMTYLSSRSSLPLQTSPASGRPLHCLRHMDTRLDWVTDRGTPHLKRRETHALVLTAALFMMAETGSGPAVLSGHQDG